MHLLKLSQLPLSAPEPAAAARRWAERLGVDRCELLRDALHRHLVRLRSEIDIEAWQAAPLAELDLTPESDGV